MEGMLFWEGLIFRRGGNSGWNLEWFERVPSYCAAAYEIQGKGNAKCCCTFPLETATVLKVPLRIIS